MKRILLLLFGFWVIQGISAQNLEREMVYPDTLRSAKDSFYVNSPKFDRIWSFPITKLDTLNLGTSGYKGVSMTIWTDIDTLQIPHVNFPKNQHIKIPIVSPKDTAICILRFQDSPSDFTQKYVIDKKGQINFEISEVYELANIALYLSECSQKTRNHPETEYSRRVKEYFEPYKNHKLIQVLNTNCVEAKYWNTYYGFRENSICYSFDTDNFLQYNTPYKNVWWDNSGFYGGAFRNMLYLIQDFSQKSNFRKFYQENKAYYQGLIERQKELLPIKQMWDWIEKEFPQRMDSYKIMFSPLIGGSHSTQRFYKGFFKEPEYQECIMFISSSESIDSKSEYIEELKEGLMSGIVFTEIDHNYVNPTSDLHIDQIKSVFQDKDFWATKDAQQNYSSEYAIFNEYMTHSLFCLYIKETYGTEVADDIIMDRVGLMNRRGYPKFEEFNTLLLDYMEANQTSVYDSYADIVSLMKQIK